MRRLIAELREHALVIGEVTLTSGATASYYVDAKRAILRQPAFGALGELVAAEANERGATAVGGMTMGADPIASAAIGDPGGRTCSPSSSARRRSSTACNAGSRGRCSTPATRCLIVEDVVTTGGSTVQAIERCLEEGLEIVGTVSRPRPPGRRRREHRRGLRRRPYIPLATIDDVYPER